MTKHEGMKFSDLIGAKHLQQTLKVSRATVLSWMNAKGLPYVHLGKDRYVLEQDFMEWVQNERTQEPQTRVRKGKQDDETGE